MIPAAFDYLRCRTVDEALDALTQHGEDAKVLAGGHSLVPVLKMRLNAPALLVDLGGIGELVGIEDRGAELHIGAMTTYQQVIDDDLVAAHAPVLAQAAHAIADPQVRHRGTVGGALAHADPAGDLGAVAVALGCDLVVAGPAGQRRVPADEFFVDYFETVVREGEILIGVVVPKGAGARRGWYEKFNRASHMWSIVGVCAVLRLTEDRIVDARVALTNMASTPVRARATEAALVGLLVGDAAGIAAAGAVADEGTAPTSDANAQADYRRHLAKILTRRAVHKALADESSGEEWR
jgi:carbon-monoxide dehydrogenase medium subunit